MQIGGGHAGNIGVKGNGAFHGAYAFVTAVTLNLDKISGFGCESAEGVSGAVYINGIAPNNAGCNHHHVVNGEVVACGMGRTVLGIRPFEGVLARGNIEGVVIPA